MKQFWECKTIEECNEYMIEEAIGVARKIQSMLELGEIPQDKMRYAKWKIAEHLEYAKQLRQSKKGL